MSFRTYMPADHRAQRTADGSITLVVNQNSEMPPLPYEFSGLIGHDVWDQRTRTVKMMCVRFSKPLFERIWFIMAMILTVTLPFPLYRLVFNAVFDPKRSDSTFFEARAAGFGMFLGVIAFLWAPLVCWKWIGVARMRSQLRQWESQDRANANGRFIPEWKVQMPGIFSTNGRVTITTPPSAAPSHFQPGAYLPPYIKAPAYVPNAPYPDQGPMPGTLAYNGAAPVHGYSGPDEKTGFQDVNLKV